MAASDEAGWRHLPTAAGATLLLWFILLTFGGGCLATYYASIGYFPRIDWQESVTYLAVLSIIGGSIVVIFSLLAFLPGVIWAEALIADCILGNFLKYRRTDNELEPCLPEIWRRVGAPFAIFIFLTHVGACLSFLLTKGHHLRFGLSLVFIAVSSLLLATNRFMTMVDTALRTWKESHPQAKELSCSLSSSDEAQTPTADTFHSSKAKYRAAFVGSALPSLVALLIVDKLWHTESISPLVEIAMWVICAAGVVAANIVVALLFGHRRWFTAALVGAFATVALLVLGEWIEGSGSPLHRIMGSYGVGENTSYVVVVGKEGRVQLEAYGLMPEQIGTAEQWKVCNAAILSRLGDEFCFRCGGVTVTLLRGAVPSWSKVDPATPLCSQPKAVCPRTGS